MGISYTFLKGIPIERHLDSFEVKDDNDNCKKLSIEEYIEAEKQCFSSLGSPDIKKVPISGRLWKGIFIDSKEAVLSKIAFSGEKYVHIRGRYDLLDYETAEEFEKRLLVDIIDRDWETVFRFKTGSVDKDPIGLISILQHPALGHNNFFNAKEIIDRLVPIVSGYKNAEIISIYGRGNFSKSFPFIEENGRLSIDYYYNEKESSKGFITRSHEAPDHINVFQNYAQIMPAKERVMFFSYTIYNNAFLGDKKQEKKINSEEKVPI